MSGRCSGSSTTLTRQLPRRRAARSSGLRCGRSRIGRVLSRHTRGVRRARPADTLLRGRLSRVCGRSRSAPRHKPDHVDRKQNKASDEHEQNRSARAASASSLVRHNFGHAACPTLNDACGLNACRRRRFLPRADPAPHVEGSQAIFLRRRDGLAGSTEGSTCFTAAMSAQGSRFRLARREGRLAIV